VKFVLCATAAEGEPVGAAGRKTWGLFSRTRGLFAESGEEKAKSRGLFALALAEGRATLGKWRGEETRWGCAGAAGVGAPWAKRRTVLGKWRNEKARWGCAGAAGMGHLGRRARDLGGMARREGALGVRRGGRSGRIVGEKAHRRRRCKK